LYTSVLFRRRKHKTYMYSCVYVNTYRCLSTYICLLVNQNQAYGCSNSSSAIYNEHAKHKDLIMDCLTDKQSDKRNQLEVIIEHISYLYLQEWPLDQFIPRNISDHTLSKLYALNAPFSLILLSLSYSNLSRIWPTFSHVSPCLFLPKILVLHSKPSQIHVITTYLFIVKKEGIYVMGHRNFMFTPRKARCLSAQIKMCWLS